MSEMKGKFLLGVSCVVMVLVIAGCAVGGYMLGNMLEQTTGQMLVAYNWSAIKIGITVALAVLAALLSVPCVITARQVCRMYHIGHKFARWSVVSTLIGVLMLLATAAAIFGVCYEINAMKLLIQMMLEMENILLVQVAAGFGTLFLCVALFLPLMMSLRVHDCVSAMSRKKRARSQEDD